MARAFASVSSQYCIYASGGLSTPLTFAAWGYPLQTNASGVLIATSNAGSADGQYLLAFGSAGVVVAQQENDSGTLNTVSTSTSYTANAWNHCAAVFGGNSSRLVYLNASGAGSSITSVTAPTTDNITVGAKKNSGAADLLMNGYVAHAAIWSAALTATEVASLYNNGIGLDPRSVRPDALVAYWPLLNNDGDQDYWGNFHLTATNSPTYAQHPPVLMRSRPKYVVLGSAAPSIATIEIAGTRQVGNTLTCNATSSPSGATFAYQWYMADDIGGTNQTAISGATSQTYELSYANIGAATKLYEGLDSAGEAFIACGATPTKDAVEGDETVSSYVSITEASAVAPVGSPFESMFIR